jgi:hypothetical protein
MVIAAANPGADIAPESASKHAEESNSRFIGFPL